MNKVDVADVGPAMNNTFYSSAQIIIQLQICLKPSNNNYRKLSMCQNAYVTDDMIFVVSILMSCAIAVVSNSITHQAQVYLHLHMLSV
jgi:hypothetical protein